MAYVLTCICMCLCVCVWVYVEAKVPGGNRCKCPVLGFKDHPPVKEPGLLQKQTRAGETHGTSGKNLCQTIRMFSKNMRTCKNDTDQIWGNLGIKINNDDNGFNLLNKIRIQDSIFIYISMNKYTHKLGARQGSPLHYNAEL